MCYSIFVLWKIVKKLDMAKRLGRVGFGLQVKWVMGQKWVILIRLKTGSGQSGCESGWVGLTYIFHMIFFFFFLRKKFSSRSRWCQLKLDMAKWVGRVGSGSDRINWIAGQTGHESKMGHFKRVKNKFRSIELRVGSGWPVFFIWFFFF